jgi:hypothetical protein
MARGAPNFSATYLYGFQIWPRVQQSTHRSFWPNTNETTWKRATGHRVGKARIKPFSLPTTSPFSVRLDTCAPPLHYLRPAYLVPRAARSLGALEVWKPGIHPSLRRPSRYAARLPSQDYASPSQGSIHDSSTSPPLQELASSSYNLIDL